MEEQGVTYAIRIPANENLPRDVEELWKRPVVRPGQKPLLEYQGFLYQAAGWKTARRVVAKGEHHPGESFPRRGFRVPNRTLPSRAGVRFSIPRGTAEQWIQEGKQAVQRTRLSCHRFRPNEVGLWRSVIAYHGGNLWRRLVLPKRIDHGSRTSRPQRLLETGGRWDKQARYYGMLLAEGHLTRGVCGAIRQRIGVLPLPGGERSRGGETPGLRSYRAGRELVGRQRGRAKPAQQLRRTGKRCSAEASVIGA